MVSLMKSLHERDDLDKNPFVNKVANMIHANYDTDRIINELLDSSGELYRKFCILVEAYPNTDLHLILIDNKIIP